ncbi:hypothetical protein [Roseateles sp.]|uniref:hypothetical protein n=1 Tax=Roseateles sp. TaxID=1971397 RepID=UPI0025CD0522|nr:hypothetical protein [Roseateles sp.]MBV8033745.1 hypothetical protein [Roseateles sp.]
MPFFVYVKIPLDGGQAERMPALHEGLERVLAAQALGELIGWGGSLSAPPGGPGGAAVSHHRLDIEVIDQGRALAVLQDALAGFAAPDGTELHYTEAGRAMQRVYAGARWAAATPSTATSRHARGPGR